MADLWLLGIEIGGTKLQLGIGDGLGRLKALKRLRVEPSGRAGGILGQIKSAVPALLETTELTVGDIKAAVVGFGGPVDTARGQTITSYQVAGWDDLPLANWVREHLGVPEVGIENDSDSAGLAEARIGAGLGHSPVLYMNIGSGIGGALVVAGQNYRGCGYGALEIGHLQVIIETSEGPRVAELEQVASGWAIARSARIEVEHSLEVRRSDSTMLSLALGRPDVITAEIVAKAAQAGDLVAASILDRAVRGRVRALSDDLSHRPQPDRAGRRRLTHRRSQLARADPPACQSRRLRAIPRSLRDRPRCARRGSGRPRGPRASTRTRHCYALLISVHMPS